jgi:pseudouridine synthase
MMRWRKMAKGIVVDGKITRPAIVNRKSGKRFHIVLYEGRKRQIRRMVEAVGNDVKNLHRVRMAGLMLGDLPEGKWRYLEEKEIKALMALGSNKQHSQKK